MADSVTGLVGEVRNQRERLETVINSIDDGIVVLDATRHVIAANDAFLARTGGRRETVLGCCCRETGVAGCDVAQCPTIGLHADRRAPGAPVRADRTRTGACGGRRSTRRRSPGPDGKVAHVVEVWRDITDRRAAEASLAESHRLASLGLLASGFSHELNTPLATVLTCVEGILREVGRPRRRDDGPRPDRRERHHRARPGAALPRRSRSTSSGWRAASGSPGEVVDPAAVVSAAARLVEPTARGVGVTLARHAPAGGPARAHRRGGAAARRDQPAAERGPGLQGRRGGPRGRRRRRPDPHLGARQRLRHPARIR